MKNKKFKSGVCAVALLSMFSVSVSADSASEKEVEFTPEVQEVAINNINYLMKESLVKAKEQLTLVGTVYPFGAALFGNGKVRYIWVGKGEKRMPPSPIALTSVREALHANALNGKIVASAVYYVIDPSEQDPNAKMRLVTELEHLPGIGLARAIEYYSENGEIKYGRAVEKEMAPKVFVANVPETEE